MNRSSAPLGIVGNLSVDQVISPVDRFPAWDEELLVDSVRMQLAGTAGYLLLAATALGLDSVVVSTVGDDEYGEFVCREVARLGVSTGAVEIVPGMPSCLGMIFVDRQGRRSILGVLGAHAVMTPQVALRHDREIARCGEVFLCGNYLLPGFSPRDALPYAAMLRSRGQRVVFDPSWDPAGWGAETLAATRGLLDQVDLYLPNEEEITHLTGTTCWKDAVDTLAGTVAEIVIKRGAAGAVHVADGAITEFPGLPIEAVNTIGAGDIFDAAFIYGQRCDWPVRRVLAFACATAAYVVAQAGERHYPNCAEVYQFASAHAIELDEVV